MPRKLLPNAAPKPKPAPPAPRHFSSIKRPDYKEALVAARRLGSATPVKKKARTKKEKERIYGPADFAAWLHKQACVGCGSDVNIEAAHIRTGGMGRKAGFRDQVPLCGPRRPVTLGEHMAAGGGLFEGCHRLQHRVGRQTFERMKNVDLDAANGGLLAAWQLETGYPLPVTPDKAAVRAFSALENSDVGGR